MKTGILYGVLAMGAFAVCLAWKGGKPVRVSTLQHNEAIAAAQPQDTAKLKSKESIHWLDFESGYAKAKKENKILLIDVYTDWCGWCKVMDRNTYTNDTVLRMLHEKFVTVKLNPEKNRKYVMGKDTLTATELHAWLGYGKTFGFPTTYFLLNPGKSETRFASIGYSEPWDFIDILNQIIAKKGR